jgi:hypothetical protein
VKQILLNNYTQGIEMTLTRQQAIKVIDERLNDNIYGRYEIGNKWPFGIFKGKDIQDIPDQYFYWHVLNNEEINRFHLTYIRSRFEVCEWDFKIWNKPDEKVERDGHYTGTSGGYYDGSVPRSPPCTEDFYWFKLRQAQGIHPTGTGINLNKETK